MSQKVVLVDGRNMAWRAHFAYPYLSSRKRPTSVIFGFLSMLLSVQKKVKAPMIIVWDGKGRTWRHELAKNRKKQYKGNRDHLSEARKIVNQQIPIVQEFLSSIGILNVEVPNLEADDLIGILATWITKNIKHIKVVIYSGDRDFYQLLSRKITILSSQGRRQGMILTKEIIEKSFGLSVKEFNKVKALCGDKSDFISNIIPDGAKRGIGFKTAIKLVKDGLDPELKEYQHHEYIDSKLHKKYKDKFSSIWKTVHENHELTKIICSSNHNKLSKQIKRRISNIFSNIETEGYNRHKSKFYYKKMINFFLDYELDDLFDRRKEFINFP